MADVREAQRHILSRSTQAEGVMLKALPGRRFTARLVALLILLFCLCQPKTDGLPLLLSFSGIASAGELSAFDRAYAAFEADRYDDAVKYAREALDKASDTTARIDAEELLLLAVSWQSGYGAAIRDAESLKAASGGGGTPDETAFLDGLIADFRAAKASLDKAAEEERAAGEKYPRTSRGLDAELQAARCTHLAYGLQAGVSAFRKLTEKYPNTALDYRARSEIALLYGAHGDPGLARKEWKDAALAFSNAEYGEQAVARLARLYESEHADDEGLRALEDIAKGREKSRVGAAAAYEIGKMAWERGDVDNAITVLRESINRNSKSSASGSAVRLLCEIFRSHRGGPGPALSEMKRVSDSYPSSEAAARATYLTGKLSLDLERWQAARDAFVTLFKHFPGSMTVREDRLSLYEQSRKVALRPGRSSDRQGAIYVWEIVYRADTDRERKAETLLRIARI